MFHMILVENQLTWNIPLLIGLVGIAVLYSLCIHRYTQIRVYQKQPLFFFLSLSSFYLTLGSPFTTISHLSFSLHMIGVSILYFVIPPLLILGIPQTLFQKMTTIPIVCKISKWVIPPRVALLVFAGLFFIYHLPFILNVFSQYPVLHNGYTGMLLLPSLCMWWPIVSPDPKQQLKGAKLKRYVTLSGVLLMPACLIFIVSALIDGTNNPFLTAITAHLCLPSETISLDILPSPFNTKYDQAAAGFVMLGIHKMALAATSTHRKRHRFEAQKENKE